MIHSIKINWFSIIKWILALTLIDALAVLVFGKFYLTFKFTVIYNTIIVLVSLLTEEKITLDKRNLIC